MGDDGKWDEGGGGGGGAGGGDLDLGDNLGGEEGDEDNVSISLK